MLLDLAHILSCPHLALHPVSSPLITLTDLHQLLEDRIGEVVWR